MSVADSGRFKPNKTTRRQGSKAGHQRLDRDELRRRLANPVGLAKALGLFDGSRNTTGGLMLICPFHPDRKPSLSLRRSITGTAVWKCFGCGLCGDVFGLVARLRQLDTRTQFPRVLAIANELVKGLPADCDDTGEVHWDAAPLGAEDYNVVATAVLRRARLFDQPAVVEYLRHRHVLEEAADAGVGAIPGDVNAQEDLLQDVADEVGAERLLRSGFCDADPGLVWPENRLLLPWLDEQGCIVTVQRRRLDDEEPRYVFPADRGPVVPYGAEGIRATTNCAPVALAEGAISVLALRKLYRRHGIDRLVLGIGGTGSWRREWATIGRDRTVFVALDRDSAGHAGAAKVRRDLTRAGASSIVRTLPVVGKDWADVLLSEEAQ